MNADANHPARAGSSDAASEGPALFRPFDLARLTIDNRIVVSPMCQY
ncbi:MAG: hypothetical protein JO128_03050, partial [Alphaproteobacteria bacterium]|nr:hypothetical protein [Alphaproteobacteria bacterium]